MNKLLVTKRQAIRDCKKIWRLVAEGKAKDKYDALNQLPDLYMKYKTEHNYCPLCTYASGKVYRDMCSACPYFCTYGFDCMAYPNFVDQAILFAQNILKLKE
jgi:hypothetical protein